MYQNVTFWWMGLLMILIFCFALLFIGGRSNVERNTGTLGKYGPDPEFLYYVYTMS